MKQGFSQAQMRSQAEALRRKIAAAQKACAERTFDGRSGAAIARVSGRGEILSLGLAGGEDLSREDLLEQIMAAVNEALRGARAAMDEASQGIAAGAGRLLG